MSDEIETAVATYTAELLAEAELGRAELAELEDHLRTLIAELRAQGMPAAQAVTEAAHRLGQPRAIAREHARVRSVFGARIGRARAWSVVALMVPMLVFGAMNVAHTTSIALVDLAAAVVLVIAMAARLTWARPIMLGGIAFWTCAEALFFVSFPGAMAWWVVLHAGLLAFLVPWRRGEITGAGMSLALAVWAFGAATFAMGFQLSTLEGHVFLAPGAVVAVITAFVATLGALLRARWAALASLVAAGGLAVACAQLAMLTMRMSAAAPELFRDVTLALVGSGALAAAIAAVLVWRTTHSRLGSLRALVQ